MLHQAVYSVNSCMKIIMMNSGRLDLTVAVDYADSMFLSKTVS